MIKTIFEIIAVVVFVSYYIDTLRVYATPAPKLVSNSRLMRRAQYVYKHYKVSTHVITAVFQVSLCLALAHLIDSDIILAIAIAKFEIAAACCIYQETNSWQRRIVDIEQAAMSNQLHTVMKRK